MPVVTATATATATNLAATSESRCIETTPGRNDCRAEGDEPER